jgi:LysR family glycine cleavage system transcriptional activator
MYRGADGAANQNDCRMPVENLSPLRPLPGLPPLNALRAFEAAGRHLSFRAAADELGVTQGAVAQQVRGLEARLTLRLFSREPRGLALTDAGRLYHQSVARAFEQLRQATALLQPEAAQVTISVTPTFASKWLIPRLSDFTAAQPEIDLRVLATERVASFRADGIDLAVRQGSPPFGASLDAELLFRQEIVAVCSPSLLPATGSAMRVDLAGLVLLHDAHSLWPRFLTAAFGAAGATATKGMRFNQTALSLDAALAGQGVALASRFLVARDLAAGRLVQPRETTIDGGQAFYLLAPRVRLSPAAAAVRDWLLREARCP